MDKAYQFMVDFTIEYRESEEVEHLLLYQKTIIQKYLSQGKLLNFAFSFEKSKAWAIFSASSIKEVLNMLLELPLSKYTKYEISKLSQYNVHSVTHDFSLN